MKRTPLQRRTPLRRTEFRQPDEPRQSLKPVGRRGKRLAKGDDGWREAVRVLWGGRCLITQEDRVDYLHCHHIYDKSYHPEWRQELWNGVLLQWGIHDMCDRVPEWHKALEQLATNQRERVESDRPLMTRVEARALLFDLYPPIREYARSEVFTG